MLLPLFTWMGNSALTLFVRDSTVWIFAFVQVLHLVSLAVFAGGVLIVDLRLLGGGMRDRPIAQVASDARPWLVWGFIGLVVTGVPQLFANSIKEYYSTYFWMKMGTLLVAFIFTFTIRRSVAFADESRTRPFQAKLVGIVSIALWAGVAIMARMIGLS
jgi:putative copper export protein